jgi:alpha-beta hydrolase superfamily lysophospholipase
LKGTDAPLDRYRMLGVSRIDHKLYDGARHEVLNESNRDQDVARVSEAESGT